MWKPSLAFVAYYVPLPFILVWYWYGRSSTPDLVKDMPQNWALKNSLHLRAVVPAQGICFIKIP